MAGVYRTETNFSSYEGSVSLYQSFRAPGRVVFAARIGGGLNQGDYEFYQAQILDGKTELRGFRKTRFYGDKKFYTNLEMRIRLIRLRTYLFPASIGILAFHDLGRVWYKDESGVDPTAPSGKSNTWHKGWGGGLWFTPFNLTVLSLEVGHSDEGTLGYIRLGYLF
jgi:hemolysin activation/secretion protein